MRENDAKSDRRYCFEIQMPNRSLLLQAEDGDTRDNWVSVMNKAVGIYLNASHQGKSVGYTGSSAESDSRMTHANPAGYAKTKTKRHSLSKQIVELEGNSQCADCGCDEAGLVNYHSRV